MHFIYTIGHEQKKKKKILHLQFWRIGAITFCVCHYHVVKNEFRVFIIISYRIRPDEYCMLYVHHVHSAQPHKIHTMSDEWKKGALILWVKWYLMQENGNWCWRNKFNCMHLILVTLNTFRCLLLPSSSLKWREKSQIWNLLMRRHVEIAWLEKIYSICGWSSCVLTFGKNYKYSQMFFLSLFHQTWDGKY